MKRYGTTNFRLRYDDPNYNLVKLLFKLSFESLLLNSTFLDVSFLLNLRKILKISYIFENLSDLSQVMDKTDTPLEIVQFHKKNLARQLLLDIFRDLNFQVKLKIAQLQK